MGIIRSMESLVTEMEEMKTILSHTRMQRKPEEDLIAHQTVQSRRHTVCVTSGLSYLGLSIATELLLRGYHVRLGVENQEHVEKLNKMEAFVSARDRVEIGVAKVMELESLCEAFNGCHGVFHTAAFTDTAGVSGYTKNLVELEAKAAENVIEACSRTPSVRRCVCTSSLLACIWRSPTHPGSGPVVDESCWSQESLCREKKLWLALGKTVAERRAWAKAEEVKVNLATICPALITGPGFCDRNSTASIAYLKGACEMFASGLLATANVGEVAMAHIAVYEDMNRRAGGRYICFDQVINRVEDAMDLQQKMRMADRVTHSTHTGQPRQCALRNTKLVRLMSANRRCLSTMY